MHSLQDQCQNKTGEEGKPVGTKKSPPKSQFLLLQQTNQIRLRECMCPWRRECGKSPTGEIRFDHIGQRTVKSGLCQWLFDALHILISCANDSGSTVTSSPFLKDFWMQTASLAILTHVVVAAWEIVDSMTESVSIRSFCMANRLPSHMICSHALSISYLVSVEQSCLMASALSQANPQEFLRSLCIFARVYTQTDKRQARFPSIRIDSRMCFLRP